MQPDLRFRRAVLALLDELQDLCAIAKSAEAAQDDGALHMAVGDVVPVAEALITLFRYTAAVEREKRMAEIEERLAETRLRAEFTLHSVRGQALRQQELAREFLSPLREATGDAPQP